MPTAISLYYQMNGITDFLVIYRKGILHNGIRIVLCQQQEDFHLPIETIFKGTYI